MEQIITGILQQLSQISVSGLDVERMYIAKHQLRQLQSMLMTPKKEEAQTDGNQNHV